MSKETNNAQNFDRLFQQKLTGHSVAPPADMWEKINNNTAASKRRRGFIWIITNDTTIMLLILLTSLFTVFGEDSGSPANASGKEADTFTEAVSAPDPKDENAVISELQEVASEDEVTIGTKATTSSKKATEDAEPVHIEPVSASGRSEDRRKMSAGHASAENVSKRPEASTGDPKEKSSSEYEKTSPPVGGLSDDNEEKVGATDARSKFLENSDAGAADRSVVKTEHTSASGRELMAEETFKLRQVKLIKPHLYGAFEEDGLKNVDVPTMPVKDLVGAKNHEIFIGAHVNFNLPLIFNQNTYGAFDGKELAYKPTFGLASGVRLGYTFKRQYGFQTGFIFYSRQGQDYDDNLNGYAARRQVKLMYFHVPILLRYKFKIKKQRKFESPWVIDLGTDIGILRSAQITYNGNEYPLGTIINPELNDMDYFKPIDVSVVLGVEKEIYFTKWLMLSIGMRTTFSGDINADGHPVENDGKNYDRSHNFTFGFTLGLNYYMRR